MKRFTAAVLVASFTIAPALAQTPGTTGESKPKPAGGFLDIGQAFSDAVAPYINALVQALIAALVGWVLVRLQQKTGIEIDEGHREAIIKSLQNQAGSLIADGAVKVVGGRVQVDKGKLEAAAMDAIKSIPDAAAHFGLTPEYVAARIVDTIPQITAGAQIAAKTTT